IKGVSGIELEDLKRTPEMKRKYLYRDRVGSNVFWGFSPLLKIGKPKGSLSNNKKYFFGESGNWETEKDSQLKKIKERVLMDYEKVGIFSPGSVDRIMEDLPQHINQILDFLDNKKSHVILFGLDRDGTFLYPGEVPAFVNYFELKLKESIEKEGDTTEKTCALCYRRKKKTSTLDKVFKFSTFDKVSILPGLSKKEINKVYPVCLDCLEKVSAGRERVDRTLTNTSVIPGIRIWVIPEGGDDDQFNLLLKNLEMKMKGEKLESLGEKVEENYFHILAEEGQGLVFHFLFWEQNNAQEMIHLMVEDVPPERLANLEKYWKQAMTNIMGNVERGLNLDWTIKSLFATLDRLAGKSKSDKTVFRDYAVKVVGKMLQGRRLPVESFKKFVVSRIPRLAYESSSWDDVAKNMIYAQVWVEYMTLINEVNKFES
ncbi:MAG: hypothetical protein GX767_06765, partial [Firmicutes bacterium]|nr:hypothetical protein [Bacillota bacterium]